MLGLERKQVTRDFWLKLFTTMVRPSVIDTHRQNAHAKSNSGFNEHTRRNISSGNSKNDTFDIELDSEIKIRKISDMLCDSPENGKKSKRSKDIMRDHY